MPTPAPEDIDPDVIATAPPAWHPRRTVASYEVHGAESRLVALVHRAGPLAEAGHNHTVAAGTLTGCALVNDTGGTWVSIVIPVADLEVDREADRHRAGQGFEVPLTPNDIASTRSNMLGNDGLAAAAFPHIRFAGRLAPGTDAVDGTLTIRGRAAPLSLLVRVERRDGAVHATGTGNIRQTTFGITPFSVLMGALRVANRVNLDYQLVLKPHPDNTSAPCPSP
ncbi:MAG: YceI family protein [Gammaproteobacteria bacterium]|nr:YceI family protein [Gammaproteobacteria bacterium]